MSSYSINKLQVKGQGHQLMLNSCLEFVTTAIQWYDLLLFWDAEISGGQNMHTLIKELPTEYLVLARCPIIWQ